MQLKNDYKEDYCNFEIFKMKNLQTDELIFDDDDNEGDKFVPLIHLNVGILSHRKVFALL